MKFSVKDIFSKCEHIRNFLQICSLLLKKSLTEIFIVCAVIEEVQVTLWDRITEIQMWQSIQEWVK